MHDDDRNKLVQQYLATPEGREVLTKSMEPPLAMRISYQMLPIFREGASGDTEMSAGPVSLALPWDQIQPGQPRFERMSRLQDKAVEALKADFSGQMLTALREGPVTRFTEDRLREAAATLTIETDVGQIFRPMLLMDARTYLDLRGQGLFGHDQECERWVLKCGHIDNFDRCEIRISRHMLANDVWVVSQDPNISRSPVKVTANRAAYGEIREFRVEFAASFTRTAWPAVVRFHR